MYYGALDLRMYIDRVQNIMMHPGSLWPENMHQLIWGIGSGINRLLDCSRVILVVMFLLLRLCVFASFWLRGGGTMTDEREMQRLHVKRQHRSSYTWLEG